MKTLFTIQLLYCLGISLCSCPYVSPYTLDDNPNISIEDSLLGKWATVVKKFESEKEIPVKLIISRKTDLEYNIAITGDLDELRPFHVVQADTVKGTAFISAIGDKQFLNITIKRNVFVKLKSF